MPDDRQSIRPAVLTEGPAVSEAERFQNAVLRPILKLQNDLLVAIFRRFMVRRKVSFESFSPQKKQEQISRSLSKDTRLRMTLLGAVIGHFTVEEYETFLGEEPELTRRTMEMMAERLQDQLLG